MGGYAVVRSQEEFCSRADDRRRVPPAYARAAGCNGLTCVLTFRLSVAKVDAPRFARYPFFRPGWWPDILGMVLDPRVDWDEVERLLTESYCVLAPKKLVALLDREEA